MNKVHQYDTIVTWKGNLGNGTDTYRTYSRDHEITINGKHALFGSSDSAFRGDPSRHTPEDLLVSSIAGCHLLWYLHLCAVNGVLVLAYADHAHGRMQENEDGSGQFTAVTLKPRVAVAAKSMTEKARTLHTDAHRMCFIARSVNFPVTVIPEIVWDEQV